MAKVAKTCHGRSSEDHCCYVNGEPCKFLEENSEEGFRWTCGLFKELKSWKKVLADSRYEPIAEAFKDTDYKDCANFQCEACAKVDRES